MKIRLQSRVITYDPKNKAVLLVRNQGRSFWCAPGGGLEEGEDVQQCAIREMFEETGLHVDLKRLLYAQELNDTKESTVIMELFWLAELKDGQILDENHTDSDAEGAVEEVRWLMKSELEALTVYPKRLKDNFWDMTEKVNETEDPFIGVF